MLFIGSSNIPVLATVKDVITLLQKTLHADGVQLLKDVIYPKTAGQDITFTCPFHKNGNENRPSAGIQTRPKAGSNKIFFHCFTCHEKGTLETLVSRCFGFQGEDFGTKWILKHFGTIEVENRTGLIYIPSRERKEEKKEIKYVSEEELDKLRYTCSYHYQRHLNDWSIETYDLGYQKDFYGQEAITFPVLDIQGRCLFVARRCIYKKYYWYPPNSEKPLYGVWQAKKLFPDSKVCYIVESMLNAITLAQNGFCAIAMLGTGTNTQIEEIKKLGYRRYIIATDPDPAGYRSRDKLIETLKYTSFVEYLDLPQGCDVNDLGRYDKETFRKIIDMYTHSIFERKHLTIK